VEFAHGASLGEITPRMVREYLTGLDRSVATKKLRLSALRHFFDVCVTRHAIVLNPALSVRGERHSQVEGRTPEIPKAECRRLLESIDQGTAMGKRDTAILSTLIYTAARVGAVAELRLCDFYESGGQWMLRFREKGGKVREIPVRHDLQLLLLDYLKSAGVGDQEGRSAPLFRSWARRERELSRNHVTRIDIARMLKRRLQKAGLSARISAHSFRVTTITDLLEQAVPLEDVQRLAGHVDPRTTRLYDRRQRKVTRNIVERISV
jgi:site-specific recombinase XerD